MNIARLFSYTTLLECELERERFLHEEAERALDRERQRFVDALRRDAGKPPIYVIPDIPRKLAPLPPAIGNIGALSRDAEVEARKREQVDGKVSRIPIPPAVGVTQSLARDEKIERLIASDDAIVKAGQSVMQNGDGA